MTNYDHLIPPGFKLVPVEERHLVIVYLGRVPSYRLEHVVRAFAEVARLHRPFTIEFMGLAPFPSASKPRHLAAVAKPSPELLSIRSALRARLVDLEHDKYSEYKPHVTIASTRLKPDAELLRLVEKAIKRSRNLRASMYVTTVALFSAESGRISVAKEIELG